VQTIPRDSEKGLSGIVDERGRAEADSLANADELSSIYGLLVSWEVWKS
jgi:hypothetical protein